MTSCLPRGIYLRPFCTDAYASSNETRPDIPNIPCTIQSFWTTSFVLSSFFWTSYLAVYFVVTLVLKKVHWSKKMMAFFLLTAWSIPFVICIAAVSTRWLGPSKYSTAGPWCWISDQNLQTNHSQLHMYFVMEAITGKFWEILTYVIVLTSTSLIVLCNRCRWQKVM